MPVCVGARAAGGVPSLPSARCPVLEGGGGDVGSHHGLVPGPAAPRTVGPGGPGGGIQGKGTPLSFSSGPWLARVGGFVCPVLRALAAAHGCPTTWLLRESVGWVTGSFLQPTTEPQRGARGVWSGVLLD